MNRRSFLGLSAGAALAAAIPFNRVWFFPKEIKIFNPVVPRTVLSNAMLEPQWVSGEALRLLKKHLRYEPDELIPARNIKYFARSHEEGFLNQVGVDFEFDSLTLPWPQTLEEVSQQRIEPAVAALAQTIKLQRPVRFVELECPKSIEQAGTVSDGTHSIRFVRCYDPLSMCMISRLDVGMIKRET